MKYSTRFINIIMFLIMIISTVLSETPATKSKSNRRSAPSGIGTTGDFALFDVNAISTIIRNNGSFDRDPATGNSGFEWPKGTGNTAIYASGIWIGGSINDTARVAVAEYSYEYEAGAILPGVNPDDPKWKVYKINRSDDALSNPDYANWPFDDGAPALKVADGTADSLDQHGKRIPGVIGDMTLWTVFNDNNPARHTNMNTLPLGVEVQLTAWGYKQPAELTNVIFYKWKLINKSTDTIENGYVSIWTDVDLGQSGDDYDGCDTAYGLGYTYNAYDQDAIYGLAPPAAGFDFLQGPVIPASDSDTAVFPDGRTIPGMKILKMTSYIKYNNDATDLGNPSTGSDVYNYMQGLTRTGYEITDSAGHPTKFMLSGDPNIPASSTNWIESGMPGDRRFIMSSGPFTMAPNDSQEVVAACLIARGSSNRNSVAILKDVDQSVQEAYDKNFNLPPPDPVGPVEISSPSLLADNLLVDRIVNPGEHLRFGFVVSNNCEDTVELYVRVGSRTINFGEFQPGMSLNMRYSYDPDDPNTYFECDVPSPFTDSVLVIPVTVWTYSLGYYEWHATATFSVVQLPATLRGTPVIHSEGNSDWKLNVLVVDQPNIKNHDYEISFTEADTADLLTLRDITVDISILSDHPLPDQYGYNMPLTYGFKVMRGDNFGLVGIRDDSTRWISPYPLWFSGYYFPSYLPAGFGGAMTIGSDLANYLTHVDPVFPPQKSYAIEIRFDTSNRQKAYRLRRSGGVGLSYVIQAVNPFVDLPFSVWDISSNPPRQLTVSWRDQNDNAVYDPQNDPLELAFIYDRTYDPDGHQWLYQGESSDPADYSDKCTVGANADIMYGLSLGIPNGHLMNENPGVLYVRPWYGLGPDDKFIFNPSTTTRMSGEELPIEYRLDQNYPNPFNPRTSFGFQIPVLGFVSLKVYNVIGQEVTKLLSEQKQPGRYSIEWDASRFSSGVYFYRLEVAPSQTGGKPFVDNKKLLLIK